MNEQTEKIFNVLSVDFEAPLKRYYVRDCFPVYYDYILPHIAIGSNLITVTGTPGIGNSVFYNYFLQRFRKEHPWETIVTVSFCPNRVPRKCIVFRPGDKEDIVYHGTIIYEPGALYLYDGPPNWEAERERMVCFTSPNESWLRSMKKIETHTRIIMPPWDHEELRYAKDLLGYPIEDETLDSRFSFFCGVARFCLSVYTEFVEDGFVEIEHKIRSISSLNQLQDCLENKSIESASLSHSIFHMHPVMTKGSFKYPRYYVLDFASPKIQHLIEQRIEMADDSQRESLVRFMKGVSVAAPLVDMVFPTIH